MMKYIKILFIFLFSFFCVTTVNAEETNQVFHFDWESKLDEYKINMNDDYVAFDIIEAILGLAIRDNFSFNDKTVIVKSDLDFDVDISDEEQTVLKKLDFSSKIELRDLNGNVLADNTLEDVVFVSGIADDKYIYLVVEEIFYEIDSEGNPSFTNKQFIWKLDENLQKVGSLEFSDEYSEISTNQIMMIVTKFLGYDFLAVKDGKIYVYCVNEDGSIIEKGNVLQTTVDLDEWNFEESENVVATYFPDFNLVLDLINNLIGQFEGMEELPTTDLDLYALGKIYPDYIINSGVRYLAQVSSDENDVAPVSEEALDSTDDTDEEDVIPLVGLLKVLDKQGNIVFEEVSTDYIAFLDTRMIGNYIISIGIPFSLINDGFTFEKNVTDIVIFDMNGEIVQTIKKDGVYLLLDETVNGFITTHLTINLPEKDVEVEEEENLDPKAALEEENTDDNVLSLIASTESYYLQLNIDTVVTGNGQVEVMRSSRKGDNVTFQIKPEEGYVLEYVKVIDAQGNILTFTDYSFTMPSADVTIEASFLPENPSTFDGVFGSIVIAIISLTCGVGCTVLLNNVKKQEIV